ncbi:hypothetical protein HanRHA438_Chr15g0718411 [Helianthus annuus]|nr:hypothetical protein HanIR_Chr15g0768141 [Helianthus annuus]KAJ0845859.1 hypothetical protein HanRHA438_Chr15g0718411 [Helianthus annuus]
MRFLVISRYMKMMIVIRMIGMRMIGIDLIGICGGYGEMDIGGCNESKYVSGCTLCMNGCTVECVLW